MPRERVILSRGRGGGVQIATTEPHPFYVGLLLKYLINTIYMLKFGELKIFQLMVGLIINE